MTCTHADLNSYQRGKCVKRRCRFLPELTQVRHLWLDTRTNQALFEAACQISGLEGLFIKWGGIASPAALPQLDRLKFLHIGSSPTVIDIEILSTLKQLIVLEIENFRRIQGLEPLSDLTRLEGLAVDGSMWNAHIVDSLQPLRHLQSLRYLFLRNLKARDGTLKPLGQLRSLVHLQTAYWWPIGDYRLLRAMLPKLRYGSLHEEAMIERFGSRP